MTCDQGRVVDFVSGRLPPAEEQSFEAHLLVCETCWRAVREDRTGRLAIEQLRVSAPPGLADRVTAAIELATVPTTGDPATAGRRRLRPRRRFAVAAAFALAVLAGVLGWVVGDHPAADPPQIARVVAMLAPPAPADPALRAGERFDFGGQPLTVRAYQVHGETTLVATSARPFPMPSRSHLVAGSSPAAWMATRGSVSLYGVNRVAGAGAPSMFVVAAMPMAQLPQVAAQLHLL